MGLGERPRPMRRVRQVVERSEQKHRIEASVGVREVASVALVRREASGTGEIDVARDEVHDLDPMAVAFEPLGVGAVGAADIEDPRAGPERSPEDLLRAKKLDPAFRGVQACGLIPALVERADLGAPGIGHDEELAIARSPLERWTHRASSSAPLDMPPIGGEPAGQV